MDRYSAAVAAPTGHATATPYAEVLADGIQRLQGHTGRPAPRPARVNAQEQAGGWAVVTGTGELHARGLLHAGEEGLDLARLRLDLAWVLSAASLVVIERQSYKARADGGRPVQIAMAMRCFGQLEGLLAWSDRLVHYVEPREWRRYHRLPVKSYYRERKRDATALVASRWPAPPGGADCKQGVWRAKDSGAGEAALLADYGRMIWATRVTEMSHNPPDAAHG